MIQHVPYEVSSQSYLNVVDFLGEHFNEMVGPDMVRDLTGRFCDLGEDKHTWQTIRDLCQTSSSQPVAVTPDINPLEMPPVLIISPGDCNVQWNDCKWFIKLV